MTTSNKRAALLARVEAAGGPDRALDAEIVAALSGGKPAHLCRCPVRRGYGAGTIFDLHGRGEGYNGGRILSADVRIAAPLTGSRDAVARLAEADLTGWWYCSGKCDRGCHASVGQHLPGSMTVDADDRPSEALALLAVVLRAKWATP